jgi:hypothetical protein
MKSECEMQNENGGAVASKDGFGTPATVTGLDCAFGGRMEKLLPPYATIPDEYKRGHTKWNKVVSRWFFSGLPKETRFVPKAGIDEAAAKAHLRAILVSFEPKHEHKEAGCAYLLSKWFEDVEVPNADLNHGEDTQ